MSGTSMDGIDAALLTTDGIRIGRLGPAMTSTYPDDFRRRLGRVLGLSGGHPEALAVGREITDRHADIINKFVKKNDINIYNIDIIGFHGQTILHRPETRLTVQIGDGAALARQVGAPVAWDFRSADVAAGGQGAPFVPVYHAALAADLELPVAILNIGGVANVTWIGAADDILAFDTGPGNGPLDDWMIKSTGQAFDRDGVISASGVPDLQIVKNALSHPYFARRAPKSLDRNDFTHHSVSGLEVADGAATLVEITVQSIGAARRHFPRPATNWIVCGGGRLNKWLVQRLEAVLAPARIVSSDTMGWNGDAVEAQAFGFLAVRVLKGLPLSLPTTTGVPYPMPGGRIARP